MSSFVKPLSQAEPGCLQRYSHEADCKPVHSILTHLDGPSMLYPCDIAVIDVRKEEKQIKYESPKVLASEKKEKPPRSSSSQLI